MKKIIKIISVLMALLMILTVFASCKKKKQPDETSAPISIAEGEGNALEARDFGGMEFIICDANDHPTTHINFSEGMDGGAVSQAMYSRDVFLESRNNLNISYVSMDMTVASQSMVSSVEAMARSGDKEYDIMMGRAVSGGFSSLATAGLLANMSDIPVLDLSGEWWSQWINQQLSLGGKMYFTTGDIVPSVYDAPAAVYANRALLTEYGIVEDPTELYEVVKSGKWTIEYLTEKAAGLKVDREGDGFSSTDEDDFYGLISQDLALSADALMVGLGCDMSSVDGENITVNTNESNLSHFADMLKGVFTAPSWSHLTHELPQNSIVNKTFKDGRAVFLVHFVEAATHDLKDMEEDYLVLPMPKSDVNGDYRSLINPWNNCFIAVPIFDTSDSAYAEDIGYVLDSLARASHDILRPVAFENVIMTRSVKDVGSSEMLDIIFNNLYLDYGCLSNFGSDNGGVSGAVCNYIFKDGNTLTSSLNTISQAAQSEANTFAAAWLAKE